MAVAAGDGASERPRDRQNAHRHHILLRRGVTSPWRGNSGQCRPLRSQTVYSQKPRSSRSQGDCETPRTLSLLCAAALVVIAAAEVQARDASRQGRETAGSEPYTPALSESDVVE